MFALDANWCATESAEAVSGSFVSPWTMRILFLLWVLFHCDAKNCAQWIWYTPIEAAGPVAGYATPIVCVVPQLTSAEPALLSAAGPNCVRLAPDPAVTSAAKTTTAAIDDFFIPLLLTGCRRFCRILTLRLRLSSFVCLVRA